MINFGVGLAPDHLLTPDQAVRRGHLFITLPVMAIMFGIWGLLAALGSNWPPPHGIAGGLLIVLFVVGPPAIAWIWWSYATPRWRFWALNRGVDPQALQNLAERQKLVWPKGHFFERTEFPYRPRGTGTRGAA